jgi:hypothetical protein
MVTTTATITGMITATILGMTMTATAIADAPAIGVDAAHG